MRTVKQTSLCAAIAILAGCGSTPPMKTYVLPDKEMPHATVIIEPNGGEVTLYEHDCTPSGELVAQRRYRLAEFEGNRTWGDPTVIDVPAGESEFFAVAVKGDWSCSWSFAPNLEAGRTYKLSAKFQDKGFFRGKECPMVLVDTATDSSPPIHSLMKSRHIGKEMCRRRVDRSKAE